MPSLDEIWAKILRRQYESSKHAADQSIIRDISVTEAEEAMASSAEIIEDYPDDKYGPSCLILGFTQDGTTSARAVQLSQSAAYQDHHRLRV